MSQYLLSASADFLKVAIQQLGEQCESGWSAQRVGPDAAIVSCSGPSLHALATRCLSVPLPFLRHLTQVRAIAAEADAEAAFLQAAVAIPEVEAILRSGAPLGLQVWATEDTATVRPADLAAGLRAGLEAVGHRVARKDFDFGLHVCLSETGAILGAAAAADSLSDWPGGRIRLRADPAEVSRAERKLEEALIVFGVPLPQGGVAIDLGASPGGWTRVLAARGLNVHAVDPADLDPAVAANPKVFHQRMKAETFLANTRVTADLLVNDMRMEPIASCQVMLACLPRLARGAHGIVTLKLAERAAPDVVREAIALLATGYLIVGARQLYHNRSEVTVAVRCR